MKFTICRAPQRSPEWFAARAGRVTGSVASDMLATVKSGEAAGRRNLRARLVAEILTGTPQEDCYINADMQRGIDLEPAARIAYEAETGHVVGETGFLACEGLRAGCSLDGDVDDFAGIVEFKCPRTATHLGYLEAGKLPAEYAAQVTHNLMVSGAGWCDFASYDDRLPKRLQLFIVRVPRDEAAIAEYRAKLDAFIAEVEAQVEKFTNWRA